MKIKLLFQSVCAYFIVSLNVYSQQDSIRTINLDEVSVVSFRVKSDMKNMPQKIQVIKKRDIQEIPNTSVSDILKKTANVDIVEYPGLQANIGMRGFIPVSHNTYTLILVNGVPGGTENLSTLDIFNADQIEILKGPYSAFFGSGAMGGVINIVTPVSKDSVRGKAGISVGSNQTYRVRANAGGRITKRLNFDLSAMLHQQNKDYKTGNNNLLELSDKGKQIMDDKSYGKVFKNTRYDNYSVNARLGYDFSNNWQVNMYQNLFVADNVLSNGNFWGTYGSFEKDIQRWSQSVSLDGKAGFNSFKFTPYFSNEDVNYYNNISDTNFITNNYNYKTYGFVLQDAISFGNHSLILGLDNNSQKFVNKQWSDPETLIAPYQPDYSNSAYGAFMQARFSLMDNKLNAAIGARYDLMLFKVYKTELISSDNSSETYNTINPNIGLKYGIIKGLNLNVSAGTAFLAPDAFKKTGSYISYEKVYKGNPDLSPEKSFSYDLGLAYSNFKRGIETSITFFDTRHKGLLVYDLSNTDTVTFKNADNSRMNGLEIGLAYDFGSLWNYRHSLKVYGNITHLLKSEVSIGTVTSDIRYVRNNNASFGIAYNNMKNFTVRLNARYIGNRIEDNWLYDYDFNSGTNIPLRTEMGEEIRPELVNQNVLEHPAFIVMDITASYTLMRKYTFGLAVQNLLDENYTEKDGYYMPGRTFTVSFEYKFNY